MRPTICCMLLALCLLTGCAPLLERTYSVSEPHSSKFWESEAAGTLRAETHQDVVNDLLLLVGQHRETAALRLYDFESDLAVADRVSVQLQLTDPDLKSRDRVVKKSEKDSLYAAMDIATVWLNRALAGKEK